MIVLCGFPLSNYYNKVKMALLEKGIPFTEERVGTGGTSEATLSASPLGKVPFLRTPQGPLCESQVIVDWLEAAWPQPPLVPADPYAAAKVRELATFIDLHLELVARELYPQALERFEQVMLNAALAVTGGHRQQAAERLGLGRNTLTRKLKELDLS